MSSFLDTKPVRGPHFLAYAVAIAAVAFTLNFAFYNFMTHHVAENEAAETIAEKRVEALAKYKAAEMKKLPKGAKADPKAIAAAAETAFKADHKAQEAFEKTEHEAHHHAVAGTVPMVSFIAIVSGVISGLAGSLLVIRRNKDAAMPAWPAFFFHIPVFATYVFIAFLPFLLGNAAHDGGLAALIRSETPLMIGAALAGLGVLVKLVLTVAPSRPQDDHDHDHDHGCCDHSH